MRRKAIIVALILLGNLAEIITPQNALAADKGKAGDKQFTVIVQKLTNIGKIKWYLNGPIMRMDLPVATLVCDMAKDKAFIYSFKTHRFVTKKVDELTNQLDMLHARRKETYSPWKKTGSGDFEGKPSLTYQRVILTGPTPRPKHVTVTETLVVSRDIKLDPRFVKLVNAMTAEEFGFGMPLHIERRATSTVRKELGKVPYLMLETLTTGKRALTASELEIPKGFSPADSVQSMLLVEYEGNE